MARSTAKRSNGRRPTLADIAALHARHAEELAGKNRIIEEITRKGADQLYGELGRQRNRLYEAERTLISQAHEIAAHRRLADIGAEIKERDAEARS